MHGVKICSASVYPPHAQAHSRASLGSSADIQEEFEQLAQTSGPVTSLTFQMLEELKLTETEAEAARRASGILPRSVVCELFCCFFILITCTIVCSASDNSSLTPPRHTKHLIWICLLSLSLLRSTRIEGTTIPKGAATLDPSMGTIRTPDAAKPNASPPAITSISEEGPGGEESEEQGQKVCVVCVC